MRKLARRRPELESLEPLVMLSGYSTAARPAVAAVVETITQASTGAQLGVLKGQYTAVLVPKGISFNFSTHGRLDGLGLVFVSPGILESGQHYSGPLTVQGSTGGKFKLRISGTSSSLLTSGFASMRFTVYDGTGKFKGASGSGTVDVSLQPPGPTGTIVLEFRGTLAT
jgi:hypothetical protein